MTDEHSWDDPPATHDELRQRLTVLGQGERADALTGSLVRAAVALEEGEPGREDERGTRFGGRPWMAADTDWPRWEGDPLSLIAQINLADMAPLLPGEELPADGILCFFYPGDELAFGGVGEEDAWPVVFTPADVDGRLHDYPEDLPHDVWNRHPPMAIEPAAELSFAERDSVEVEALPRAAQEAWAAATPHRLEMHRFLGHAMAIQNDLAGDVAYHLDQPAPRESRDVEARRWRLLLQVDSNDDLGFSFGDAGCLYWMIRDEDLRAGRFETAFLILQCC